MIVVMMLKLVVSLAHRASAWKLMISWSGYDDIVSGLHGSPGQEATQAAGHDHVPKRCMFVAFSALFWGEATPSKSACDTLSVFVLVSIPLLISPKSERLDGTCAMFPQLTAH